MHIRCKEQVNDKLPKKLKIKSRSQAISLKAVIQWVWVMAQETIVLKSFQVILTDNSTLRTTVTNKKILPKLRKTKKQLL